MGLQDILQQYKKSYTLERERVFQCIKQCMPKHFDAQALSEHVAEKDISRASTFRTLALFEEVGLVRRIDHNTEGALYELYLPHDHHEHMRCQQCKEVIEFESNEFHEFMEKVAEKYDFHIENHIVTVYGVCKQCFQKKK